MKSGVYQITNVITGSFYIGSSNNIHRRRLEHFGELRNGIHHNKHLQRSFNKYGEDAFDFKVLEKCNVEERFKIEQKYLDQLKPDFNVAIVADGGFMTGIPMSEELKKQISKRMTGRKVSKVTRQRLREHNLGKKHSEKTVKKISSISRKNWENPDYQEKISKKRKGMWNEKNKSIMIEKVRAKAKSPERVDAIRKRMKEKFEKYPSVYKTTNVKTLEENTYYGIEKAVKGIGISNVYIFKLIREKKLLRNEILIERIKKHGEHR